MTKNIQVLTAILGAVLFCSATLAQEPTVDIDKNMHPNLYQSQSLLLQAAHYVDLARQDNRYDMKGHAEKAKELMIQANQELRAAASAANAAMKK